MRLRERHAGRTPGLPPSIGGSHGRAGGCPDVRANITPQSYAGSRVHVVFANDTGRRSGGSAAIAPLPARAFPASRSGCLVAQRKRPDRGIRPSANWQVRHSWEAISCGVNDPGRSTAACYRLRLFNKRSRHQFLAIPAFHLSTRQRAIELESAGANGISAFPKWPPGRSGTLIVPGRPVQAQRAIKASARRCSSPPERRRSVTSVTSRRTSAALMA